MLCLNFGTTKALFKVDAYFSLKLKIKLFSIFKFRFVYENWKSKIANGRKEVEEMRDFFSQKKTFEEISATPQTRHPCIRGYSVKSINNPWVERDIRFLF